MNDLLKLFRAHPGHVIPVGRTVNGQWQHKVPSDPDWAKREYTEDHIRLLLDDSPFPIGAGIRLGPDYIDVDIDAEDSSERETAVAFLEREFPEVLETVGWRSARGNHYIFQVSSDQRKKLREVASSLQIPSVQFGGNNSGAIELRHGCGKARQSVLPPYSGREWLRSWLEQEALPLPPALFARFLETAPLQADDSGDIAARVERTKETLKAGGRSVQGEFGSMRILSAYRTILRDGFIGPVGEELAQWFATECSDPPWAEHGSQGWRRKWRTALESAEKDGDAGANSAAAIFADDPEAEDIPETEQEPEAPSLPAECFDNPIGEYVRDYDAHVPSEAPPDSVFMQAFEIFGCMVGRDVFIQKSASRMYLNGYLAVVGDRATGRKGTAYNAASQLFSMEHVPEGIFEPETHLAQSRFQNQGGLFGSGEALVKGLAASTDEASGVSILLSYCDELEVLFSKGSIERSTLFHTLNSAWDGKFLSTATASARATVDSPHYSIVGHIQPNVLQRVVTPAVQDNGFLSRWTFCYSKRHRTEFDGGQGEGFDFRPYIEAVNSALLWAAAEPRKLRLSPGAFSTLKEFYGPNSERYPRGHETAWRSAGRLAALRLSEIVSVEDTLMGIAIAQYSAAVREYFLPRADSGFNREAICKRILGFIKPAKNRAATATELRRAARPAKADHINASLEWLVDEGYLRRDRVKGGNRYTYSGGPDRL